MKSSKLLAVVVAVVAALWISSGLLGGKAKSNESGQRAVSASVRIMDVRVREIASEQYADDIVVTGRTHSSKTVELKAEISGQLKSLLKEEGDLVVADDVLAKLELQDRAAKLREAKQRVAQRNIEYNAAKQLEGKGFNSKVRLAQSLADLESARAQLKLAEVLLSKTKILAPFDGIVSAQNVEKGDYLSVGDTLFTVVDLDPIEFVGFISERRIQEISIGKAAQAEFLNGMVLKGIVTYVSPVADQETRTFRIVISAPNEGAVFKEGLTARIRISVSSKRAHKISSSILSLNDVGKIGVKIVNVDNKVEFIPVTILSDRTDAMWISGVPDMARVITVGQDFVIDGQTVNPVLSTGDGLL